jgi:hypothetical protein
MNTDSCIYLGCWWNRTATSFESTTFELKAATENLVLDAWAEAKPYGWRGTQQLHGRLKPVSATLLKTDDLAHGKQVQIVRGLRTYRPIANCEINCKFSADVSDGIRKVLDVFDDTSYHCWGQSQGQGQTCSRSIRGQNREEKLSQTKTNSIFCWKYHTDTIHPLCL